MLRKALTLSEIYIEIFETDTSYGQFTIIYPILKVLFKISIFKLILIRENNSYSLSLIYSLAVECVKISNTLFSSLLFNGDIFFALVQDIHQSWHQQSRRFIDCEWQKIVLNILSKIKKFIASIDILLLNLT